MSLEQLADLMKGRPELDAHAKERLAERGRQPFHDGFLREVYEPFWQAPLRTWSRAAGVARVGHGSDTVPDLGVSFGPLTLVISEDVFVELVVGVTVKLSYVFAGDVNDGQLIRIPSRFDAGKRTLLSEHAKVWLGPIDRLLAAAEGDIGDASVLLPTLMVEAVQARDTRIAREEKERAEAEAADKAAAEKAKADEEERHRLVKEAALEAARVLEAADAKAEAPAPPAPAPEAELALAAVGRRRGKPSAG